MSETIRLEIRAAEAAFAPVRMVLGGLGARIGFNVDQLDDLYLATEELFLAVLESEDLPRFGAEMRVDHGTLRFAAGPFTSATLRERVKPSSQGAVCIDLCRVLHVTCDDVEVDDSDGTYRVILVKSREGRA
jgi:hypothetical protein